MRLSALSLRNFRNLAAQRLEFPPDGVAVIGPNAQGKSNLLEAIYYLETLRSFRGAQDAQLVRFGEDHFRIAATLSGEDGGDSMELAAAFERQQKRKKVTVDGTVVERLSDGLGHLAAVMFSPADAALVSGGPVERRRHVDMVLSLNQPGYLAAAQRFRQALAQRNAALRAGAGAPAVRAWEPPLLDAGAAVMGMRADWVDRWADRFAELYTAVSGGERARLRYEPQVTREDGEPWAEAYARALAAVQERDRRLGNTGAGPHRDDLDMTLEREAGGTSLRDFGSGGQRRTAALALRLVEAETIRASRGQPPMVLLDDVFAELDEARSERVMTLFDEAWVGQVILTAPKESDVRVRAHALTRWSIAQGVISA